MTEIENLTPPHLRCAIQVSCPSLYKLPDGRLLVVGKFANTEAREHGVGMDGEEEAVIIEAALLDTFVAEKVKEERERCAKLVDEFHWQLPMFADAKDNELTDDAAEAVRDQIVAMLRALTPSSPGGEP